MDKFWKFIKNEAGDTELVIDGVIASQSWWGDEVTPKQFKSELKKHSGDITVRINSPGGDVFAGVSIYNALMEHDGKVTVKVEALAASAASFIAMAGEDIIMLPGSLMMIHNPWTFAVGNEEELAKVVEMLQKVGSSVASIYVARTGKSEEEINQMLKDETWMTGEEAVANGFATEAREAKKPASTSDLMKNISNYMQTVTNAVKQPAMSIRDSEKPLEDMEELHVSTSAKKTPADDTGSTTTKVKTEAEKQEPVKTEVVEPVAPVENKSTKESKVTEKDKLAASQVIDPKNQAPVDTAPKKDMKAYLKSNDAMEAFARILEENPGEGPKDQTSADRVRNAWKEHLETKMGVTNPEIFLPTPLIQEIEDAFKEGGEIWRRVSKTGMDSFNAAWDMNDDPDAESGRASGYNRAEQEEKREQQLEFDNRILRPQFVYKYITLNREDVKEQRTTGALVRFVLSELPRRIIREIERAIVIGDGRAPGSDYKIQEGTPRGFFNVKADATAGNIFASTYTPVPGQTVYETLRRARAAIKAEGEVILVAKEGLLLDMEFEQNVNGGFLFAPGSDMARYIKVSAVVEPDWMDNDENDAYMFVASKYRVVGDQSIEAFQNFLLKTNKNEYLQEIWAGGGLTAMKSGIAIAAQAS